MEWPDRATGESDPRGGHDRGAAHHQSGTSSGHRVLQALQVPRHHHSGEKGWFKLDELNSISDWSDDGGVLGECLEVI